MSEHTNTNTGAASTKAAKKAAKKVTTKAAKKAGKAAPKAAPAATEPAKRGNVLTTRTIRQIIDFVGGDMDTKIDVSKRSLVDARMAGQRAKIVAQLDDVDDLA